MVDVKYIAPIRIGGTDIEYAQGARAGSWLFFTGHMASDFEHGLAAEVAGKPGLPRALPPRYRREGDFIIDRFARLIAAEGGDLRHIVRVDQYYPDAQVVNAYQRARKAVLKNFVPPSTSVLMEELLVGGANMDVSMLAVQRSTSSGCTGSTFQPIASADCCWVSTWANCGWAGLAVRGRGVGQA